MELGKSQEVDFMKLRTNSGAPKLQQVWAIFLILPFIRGPD